MEGELHPGDAVTVTVSDAVPFEAVVRSVLGVHVYVEGSSIPYWIGSVSRTEADDRPDFFEEGWLV